MIGAIAGDIIGSIYESNNIKKRNLNYFLQNQSLLMILFDSGDYGFYY